MRVELAYGRSELAVELPDERTTIIAPSHTPGLEDERGAVVAALENPIGARPLREWIGPGERICILFTDITRATPNDRIIPWLLDYLGDVPPQNITLLNQLGTHRPNTRSELEQLLTPVVVQKYRVLNHEPEDPAALAQVGTTSDGTPALLNRHFLEARARIVPGIAGLQTVMSNHGAKNIGHPCSAFGVTDGNPIWEEMRDIALRAGPSFLLNVALNERRQITGVFAGDLIAAHKVGCEFVRNSAMQKFDAPFDIVVTTNSGYPLDQNLYQGVKGMSAGARVIKPGGTILLACECREGVPPDSWLDRILRSASSPEEILSMLATPGFRRPEQWQAQTQALIQRKARVLLYSSLPDDVVRAAHLTPCRDIGAAVKELLPANGARVAALPQGPLTIPYLAKERV